MRGVSILVPNLPDLGLTPEAKDRDKPGDLEGLVAASTMVSVEFNAVLDAVLDSFPILFPAANIIELDIFSILNEAVFNPPAFGFADGMNPCVSFATVCPNPDDFVFLDGVHPTAAGHAVIARAALAAVPEPATIMLMGLGLAGLGFARRRRNSV